VTLILKDGNARYPMIPLKSYSDQKCGRYRRFSDSNSIYLFWKFHRFFLETINAQFIFAEKQQMKINNLTKQKYKYFIHTWSDKAWYRCKSGIAILKWRVTWNYAYSPFKSDCLSCCKKLYTDKENVKNILLKILFYSNWKSKFLDMFIITLWTLRIDIR